MKKKELQDWNWNMLIQDKSDTNQDYINWIIKTGREYLKEKEKRSFITKLIVFIFGDTDVLGSGIIKDYGEHNIRNAKYESQE